MIPQLSGIDRKGLNSYNSRLLWVLSPEFFLLEYVYLIIVGENFRIYDVQNTGKCIYQSNF